MKLVIDELKRLQRRYNALSELTRGLYEHRAGGLLWDFRSSLRI